MNCKDNKTIKVVSSIPENSLYPYPLKKEVPEFEFKEVDFERDQEYLESRAFTIKMSDLMPKENREFLEWFEATRKKAMEDIIIYGDFIMKFEDEK